MLLTTCAGCGERGESPCAVCVARLQHANPPCPEGVDSCVAVFLFEGVGRTIVTALKYRNQRQSLPWMSTAIAELVVGQVEIDVVTWIPTTAQRRRSRGFDQAELLARRVARRLKIKPVVLLRPDSARSAPSQTGLSATERHERVAFRAHRKAAGLSVLVIDDVITTGASIEAAARSLCRVGATQIHAAAVAYTPAPSDR